MMKAASSAEPCLTGRCSAPRRRARHLAAEAAEDHRDERAVHALAHDVGQDRARGADQRAGDDQRRVAEREADAGRRPARIGVEHRDHDRHVGAADRDDDEHAEQRTRRAAISQNASVALRCEEPDDRSTISASAERDVDDVARRAAMIGAPLMRPDELEERDHRAGEGDGADGDAERHLDQALRRGCAPSAPMPKAAGA